MKTRVVSGELKSRSRGAVLTGLFIGLSFLVFETEYISWNYCLGDCFPAETVHVIGRIVAHFLQAIGVLTCILRIRRLTLEHLAQPVLPIIILWAEFLLTLLSIAINNGPLLIFFGVLLNLLIGVHCFYVISALFAIIRTLYTLDISDPGSAFLWYAAGGFFLGRVGEALSEILVAIMDKPALVNMLVFSGVGAAAVILLIRRRTLSYVARYGFHPTDILDAMEEEPESEEEEKNEPDFDGFAEHYGFSGREREVLALMLEGVANPEISERLYISVNTVKFHVKNILKKTECANRIKLSELYRGEEGTEPHEIVS